MKKASTSSESWKPQRLVYIIRFSTIYVDSICDLISRLVAFFTFQTLAWNQFLACESAETWTEYELRVCRSLIVSNMRSMNQCQLLPMPFAFFYSSLGGNKAWSWCHQGDQKCPSGQLNCKWESCTLAQLTYTAGRFNYKTNFWVL